MEETILSNKIYKETQDLKNPWCFKLDYSWEPPIIEPNNDKSFVSAATKTKKNMRRRQPKKGLSTN